MTIRFFIMPLNNVPGEIRTPKYLYHRVSSPTGFNVPWSGIDAGYEPLMILWADVTNAQRDAIAGDPDVVMLPLNLDNTVNAAVASTATAYLDARRIPSQWLAAGMTYRRVLKILLTLFTVFGKLHAYTGALTLHGLGITLGTTYAQLPVDIQTVFRALAVDFGYDPNAIPANATVRQMLAAIADVMKDRIFAIEQGL